MVNVYWLTLNEETPSRGYWDQGMLEDYFAGDMWRPKDFPEFRHIECDGMPTPVNMPFGVVVLAARHHADKIKEVNKSLNKLDRVVLFLTGDEEADFPIEKIDHKNIEIWVMSPRTPRHDKYNHLGTGYPPQSQKILSKLKYEKTSDVFFSGQLTHRRRLEMWDNLKEYEAHHENVDVHGTRGFTQGFKANEYYTRMARAKVAPAPSGPETPDSFRLFEALECMSIPIADEQDPKGTWTTYWAKFFKEQPPFPLIKEYDNLVGYITNELKHFDNQICVQTAWWIQKKRELAYKITEQINEK